jgi:GNAT superfamily N-acetyltransferase
VVGVVEGEVKGVGLIEKGGDLRLCYVHPDRQRSGLGRAMVDELEKQASRWGLREIRLTSSANARTFYECHGYVSAGQPIHEFGVLWDYPYRKDL